MINHAQIKVQGQIWWGYYFFRQLWSDPLGARPPQLKPSRAESSDSLSRHRQSSRASAVHVRSDRGCLLQGTQAVHLLVIEFIARFPTLRYFLLIIEMAGLRTEDGVGREIFKPYAFIDVSCAS
jgi:hypothetical protein